MAAGDGSSNLSLAGLSFSHRANRPWFSRTAPRALETIPEHAGGGCIASTGFVDQEGQELDNLDGAGQLRFNRISSGLVEPIIYPAESERNGYWHESPLGSHPPHDPFQSPPCHFVINIGNCAWPRAAEPYCNSRQQQRSPGRHHSGRYVPGGINWCSGRRLPARYGWKRRTTYVVAGTVLLAIFFYGLYMAVPKKQ